MESASGRDGLGFLDGGGAMGALMREHDWSHSAIGDPSTWPQSLRTATNVALNSRFPILLWWGPQLVMIYNDGYVPMLGDKHPDALGAPGREAWADIWHVIGPMLDSVLHEGRRLGRSRRARGDGRPGDRPPAQRPFPRTVRPICRPMPE